MSARFDNCVLAALRFKMIFRLMKCDPGALFDVVQDFLGKIEMAIQTSADCGSAQCDLAQSFDSFLRTRLPIRNLLRVSGEFLAQPNRCRVHQMRPTDLDDVPKFLRFCFKRGV